MIRFEIDYLRALGTAGRAASFGILLLLVYVPTLAVAADLQDEWSGVERVVTVGDVHGDYDGYINVLKDAGIVNRRGKWVAGETHLVQIGDVSDRGPDTAKIIRHLKKLEKQARKAGGYVHALIGNHEAMNMLGDLRYVHPGEYEALKSRKAKALRDAYYRQVVAYLEAQENGPIIDEAFETRWMEEHPLGYVEHRQHWDPSGEFGEWVLERNAAIKINDTLFLHAGLGPAYADLSIRQINKRIRSELANPAEFEDLMSESEEGPLWYRGLARPGEGAEEYLDTLLLHFGVQRVVIGHTPGYGTIVPTINAKVLNTDSGIGAHYGGHEASLLIEGDRFYTRQRGETVPLPAPGESALEYLTEMARLKPDVRNLQALVYQLSQPAESAPVDVSPSNSAPADQTEGSSSVDAQPVTAAGAGAALPF
ncbi:MAG: metallophosphoesterase [Pseudomonadota bacterium]